MGNRLLGFYQNPDMPPEVAKLLAERGFNPDGSRMEGLGAAFDGLSTQQRLDALNQRISADWQQMGFDPSMPPQDMADPRAQYVGNNTDIFLGANSPMANTGPDLFGQETRQKLATLNQRIDADMAAMDAPAPVNTSVDTPRNPIGGMSYTPALPPPPPAAPPVADVPKPKPRPRPTTYVVRAGDNPTTIARKLGMSLKELEAKNPGLLKKARRLKIGSSLKV